MNEPFNVSAAVVDALGGPEALADVLAEPSLSERTTEALGATPELRREVEAAHRAAWSARGCRLPDGHTIGRALS